MPEPDKATEAIQISDDPDIKPAQEASETGSAKVVDRYVLVGNMAHSREDFLAVLRYVGQYGPAVGSDEAEACQARHVIILGSTHSISPAVEQRLVEAGCQVKRIERDYAHALDQMLSVDIP